MSLSCLGWSGMHRFLQVQVPLKPIQAAAIAISSIPSSSSTYRGYPPRGHHQQGFWVRRTTDADLVINRPVNNSRFACCNADPRRGAEVGTNSASHADTAWVTRVYEHGGRRSGIQGGCQYGVYNIATPFCVRREQIRLFRGQAKVQAADVHRKEKSTTRAPGVYLSHILSLGDGRTDIPPYSRIIFGEAHVVKKPQNVEGLVYARIYCNGERKGM
ncbi:hypothetical protein B0H17DRAFT_1240741 [Mycena rosella]|uniref:Uncharacterized protein n=1 Tax=Mycena rosella TaxID=1033263 RepID=A0AAD7D5N4_MYCRO|nr:hypothetical protein B0H17DRAFT_1240741 [Mycena rosella]